MSQELPLDLYSLLGALRRSLIQANTEISRSLTRPTIEHESEFVTEFVRRHFDRHEVLITEFLENNVSYPNYYLYCAELHFLFDKVVKGVMDRNVDISMYSSLWEAFPSTVSFLRAKAICMSVLMELVERDRMTFS